MAINFKQCPKCGSKNSVPILYGFPAPELFEKAEAGKVKLGGCCIEENSPECFCKDCNNEWNKDQSIDKAYKQIKGIKASVGGFFEGYYLIEVDLISLHVIWTKDGGGIETEVYQKNINAKTAEQFIDHLKLVKLLDWKSDYCDPGVLDGTQWDIEIIREGRNLRISGSNAFPDEWNKFCSIMAKISDRDFR